MAQPMPLDLFSMLWKLRRRLKLSPTQQVFREIQRRKIRLGDLVALELFAHRGELSTRDYAPLVSSLDLWEINPSHEQPLRQHFPQAEVKITDSYQAIRNHPKKYSLMVIDNPVENHGGHIEHFDLFPDLLGLAMDSTVLMMNVITEANASALRKMPGLFNEVHLARRRSFYRTNHPEKVSLQEMSTAYQALVEAQGFKLEWCFFRRRSLSTPVYWLVLHIRRSRT